MSAVPAEDLHEWISFEDPGEHRTWIFDATFLRSNHRCIWGDGCQGVLDDPAEELLQGCCSYGAHLVDDDDVQTVVRAFVKLRPEHMQFHTDAVEHGFLRPDGDATATRLVDDACVFLNRPGFDAGAGCALHIGALAAGERPLDWKPNVCWQLPIRLEHLTDDNGHVISRLREWKRRDWGDGGADFHRWCTEDPAAFSGDEPVYVAARDEIVELVGEGIYDTLVEQLERPGWVPLPHPIARSVDLGSEPVARIRPASGRDDAGQPTTPVQTQARDQRRREPRNDPARANSPPTSTDSPDSPSG